MNKKFWVTVFASELLVALGGGAVMAAILLPMAYAIRERFTVGGEWLAVAAVALAAYFLYHRWLYGILERDSKMVQRIREMEACIKKWRR